MRRLLPAGLSALLLLVTASVALGHPESAPYTHIGTHRIGLPDLKADPSDGMRIEATSSTTLNRLLLRFHGYIYNSRTAGTLEIHGSNRTENRMGTVQQRIYDGVGSTWNDVTLPNAAMVYETGDGHNHWHWNGAARYSLLTAGTKALVAPSAKVGFCAIDSQNDYYLGRGSYIPTQWAWETSTDPGHGNCGDRQPLAGQTVMGLTPGWRDKYGAHLYNQWVDISNVLPGNYLVRNEVDPTNQVIESDEVNPPADTAVTIPGYLAGPTDVSTPISAAVDVPLDIDYVSSPLDATREAPKIRIANAPDHGTLDIPTGTWVAIDATSPSLRYTPDAGSVPGADSFTYEVREGDSPFPRTPSRAGVAITTTGTTAPLPEEVVISGGGGTLVAGTTRQLSAQVANPAGTGTIAEWAVQGVAGGSATVGTISPTGLYTAPSVVPADESVDITATTDTGVVGRTTITITAPPPVEPIPTANTIDPTSTLPITFDPASTMTLSSVKATLVHYKTAVIGMTPNRSGRVVTTLYNGKQKRGSCTATVTAGVRYTCRIGYRTPANALSVRILATRS